MTPDEKALVRDTWARVVPIADTAAELFYGRLFATAPATRAMFKSTDMAEQRRKLMQVLGVAVHGLEKLDQLQPVVADLGRRHIKYGVTDEHYDAVGAALLWTLEQGLNVHWTPETAKAWTSAYLLLAGIMRAAAADEIGRAAA